MMIRKAQWLTCACATMLALSAVACGGGDDDGTKGGQGPGFGKGEPGDLFEDPGLEDGTLEGCGAVAVTFTQRIPYVVVLVDQSGSMEESFGNDTRWNVMRSALLNEQDGVIKRLENDVRFGLSLYTSENGNEGGTCPMIQDVGAPQFGNYDNMRSLYDGAEPFDDTPTGESIVATAQDLEKIYVEQATPKVIILATDGYPDTCEQPDPQNGQDKTIASAQEAFGMGVQTFVLSVGDELSDEHLQELANAGAGLPIDSNVAPFWKALNQDELYDAFTTIINGVRECVFTLDGTVNPGYEDQGTVLLDGQPLTKDDPDGWKLNNNKEIQLLGAACEEIQNGDHDLVVDFPCGGYEAPPIY